MDLLLRTVFPYPPAATAQPTMGDKVSGALKSAAGIIAGEGLPEWLLARWDAEGGRD
jgi:hypothetical protein